ncbi:MAG: hypothetical protein WCD72_06670 [Dehalococcoidia bacterium]
MPPILNRDAVIATALRIRGVEVRFVICDGAPVACILREVVSEQLPFLWGKKCPGCLRACANEAASFNLPYDGIGELVSEERRAELRVLAQSVPADELATFRHLNVEVGQLAVSSTIRYFKGLSSEGHEDIVREYLYASLVNTEAAITAIACFKPDCLVMTHACYVDYGTAQSVATNAGIPVVVWAGAYLERHCYMNTKVPQSRNRSYQLLSAEAWRQRRELHLTRREDERLDSYLNARYTTDVAFDLKLSSPPVAVDELRRKLDIPGNKPVWCIFAHVSWDDVFSYGAQAAFDTAELWFIDTIRTIMALPDVTWLVKLHPAEIPSGTVYGVQSLIEEHFPELPHHVRLIPADSDINVYGLYPVLDGGVTMFGTAGLEMAVLGKPVILAGEAHYGRKGFTYDAPTQEEYRALLRRAAQLPKLSATQQALARQYAYSYFIQRQIPLRMLERGYGGWGPLDYQKLDLLLPGKDKALDMICEHILEGGDFIMDEDMVAFYSALK